MSAANQKNSQIVSIAIIGVFYFILGFVTWLNGTLIPFLKLACNLQSDSQPLLVTFAFYIAYTLLALPSSYILNWIGYKRGMSLGLLIMAGGALIFIPAALSRAFGLFLTGLFVQAAGLALLQTAVNPYVTVLGPIESAARRISIMGICNKVAGALSPLVLSAIVLKGASEIEAQVAAASNPAVRDGLLTELAHRIIAPYGLLAAVVVALALMVLFAPLPNIDSSKLSGGADREVVNKTSVLQFPHLLLGVLCIFVYVGVEVMAGDVIGTYGASLGMSLDETKNFTSYTLSAMLVGYTIGIFTIPKYLSQQAALKGSAILGLIFTVLVYVTSGYTSVLFVALLGLANALMWPAIFPLAIDGLGRFTERGAALLIMGISGGAIIPQIYGNLTPHMPVATAFLVCTLPCYLFILYYAVSGARVGRDARVPRTEASAAGTA